MPVGRGGKVYNRLEELNTSDSVDAATSIRRKVDVNALIMQQVPTPPPARPTSESPSSEHISPKRARSFRSLPDLPHDFRPNFTKTKGNQPKLAEQDLIRQPSITRITRPTTASIANRSGPVVLASPYIYGGKRKSHLYKILLLNICTSLDWSTYRKITTSFAAGSQDRDEQCMGA